MKIISGGQTGADRAALDFALASGIPIGGWVPRGRLAEDGRIPERYAGLVETESADPAVRTARNVRDSDATLILSHGPLDGGSLLTHREATRAGRPVLHLDLEELEVAVAARSPPHLARRGPPRHAQRRWSAREPGSPRSLRRPAPCSGRRSEGYLRAPPLREARLTRLTLASLAALVLVARFGRRARGGAGLGEARGRRADRGDHTRRGRRRARDHGLVRGASTARASSAPATATGARTSGAIPTTWCCGSRTWSIRCTPSSIENDSLRERIVAAFREKYGWFDGAVKFVRGSVPTSCT